MLVKKVFESKLPHEKCIFQYFKLKHKFLSSSDAEPKLFIAAPAPTSKVSVLAPTSGL